MTTKNTNNSAAKTAQAQAEKATDAGTTAAPVPNTGLGYNGEFKIGRITLATKGDGSLQLRLENNGDTKEVDEHTLAGLLEDNFFTEKFESKDDLKGNHKG